MSNALRDRLRDLALDFASEVAAALYAAPVEELAKLAREGAERRAAAPDTVRRPKRARKTVGAAPARPPPTPAQSEPTFPPAPVGPAQVPEMLDRLVAILRRGHPLPAARLGRFLGIGGADLAHVLQEAMVERMIARRGGLYEYVAPGTPRAAPSSARPPRRKMMPPPVPPPPPLPPPSQPLIVRRRTRPPPAPVAVEPSASPADAVRRDGDDARDPHGLLASGEPLARASELAALLGVSGKALRELLGGPLYPRPDATGPVVRFVRGSPGPLRYCVADARAAIEPYRGAIEERRRHAAEREAREREARLGRTAESGGAAAAGAGAATTRRSDPPPARRWSTQSPVDLSLDAEAVEPEVLVRPGASAARPRSDRSSTAGRGGRKSMDGDGVPEDELQSLAKR